MTASSTSGTIAWLHFLGSAFGALFALESIGVCGTAACFSGVRAPQLGGGGAPLLRTLRFLGMQLI